MYVCICHSVTDRQIRQAAADGTETLEGLRQTLKVASSCGKCASCARSVLEQARREFCGACGEDFCGAGMALA
jgi:bacterioferritin-associated ferredoxin